MVELDTARKGAVYATVKYGVEQDGVGWSGVELLWNRGI